MFIVNCLTWFHLFGLKITKILKTGPKGLEKIVLPWKRDFIISVGVSPLEL